MRLETLTLASAALGIGLIGIGYVISPNFMFGLYGINLQSIDELNMVRSAYGGLFIAFACLFASGALQKSIQRAALFALLTFMAGFAVGRILSAIIDGMPSPLISAICAVEAFYAAASAYFLTRRT